MHVPARRLKATLERLQRLTGGYADALLAVLPARGAALGDALGLDPARVQVPHAALLATVCMRDHLLRRRPASRASMGSVCDARSKC